MTAIHFVVFFSKDACLVRLEDDYDRKRRKSFEFAVC